MQSMKSKSKRKPLRKCEERKVKGWYSEAIKKWNAMEGTMKKRCEDITVRYQAALMEWEEEKKSGQARKKMIMVEKASLGTFTKG